MLSQIPGTPYQLAIMPQNTTGSWAQAEINSRRWHNYNKLNRDESISAAGFQSLSERE